jgi:hypothetical protein
MLKDKSFDRDNFGNIIGHSRKNFIDIVNTLNRPFKWKARIDGLSTDSYLALLK